MAILKRRAAALLSAASLLHSIPLWATTYTFDTTKATLNGQSIGTFFGDQLSVSMNSNITTFTFNGNLAFAPGDSIVVTGNNALNVLSYGDITLPSGLTVNVSASGTTPVAGGGTAGAGGTAGTAGAGGAGPTAPFGIPDNGSGGGGGGFELLRPPTALPAPPDPSSPASRARWVFRATPVPPARPAESD